MDGAALSMPPNQYEGVLGAINALRDEMSRTLRELRDDMSRGFSAVDAERDKDRARIRKIEDSLLKEAARASAIAEIRARNDSRTLTRNQKIGLAFAASGAIIGGLNGLLSILRGLGG